MVTKSRFRPFLFAALILIVLGWGGLALVVNLTLPTVWPRWGFFALWTLAWTGTAMPVAYFLNLRFPSQPLAGVNVIIRQSLWAGVYFSTLAWLQLARVVNLWVILGLAGGILAIEYFLRLRERSQWYPPENPDDEANGFDNDDFFDQ